MIDSKYYSWQEVEAYILNKSKEKDYYSDVSSEKQPYTIIMPPPNVTGSLHMGHALVTTLQDVMVRYKRMKGFDVLWQPGVDHAGIATQVIIEKQLAEKGLKRSDLNRETFIEKAYEWKENSAGNIIGQIKKMGSSCDFSYLAFTMDEQSIKGVNKSFLELYKAGLIYQDDRLVNWDSKLQTAISDLEVENKEVKGSFYYLKYKLVGSDEYLVVGTTRPETIFGDSALAVNPMDDRYKSFIGKEAIIPFVNKKVKIVADDCANMEKGSGVVKITPAHDFNDFDVGKRHDLESINILNKDGTLNGSTPDSYKGLSVLDARKKIVNDLKELDLIEKIDDTMLSVPYGDRTGVVVEPLLTKQWFLDAQYLAKDAIKAVEDGRIEFVPTNWQNLYFEWMRNIKPWCISRQLWWGHRLPVYYGEDGKIFVAETKGIAESEAKAHYGRDVYLRQDEDVLDTWFSSGLWSFLTLGWPEDTEKLKKYYPTDLLVTAFDIIFFWVARMIMMGMFFMKEVPFKKIYIHGLIRDEKGQKMSKSKGNVIDPLTVIDKYGTDALRFSLVAYSGQGSDIKLSEKTIEGYRNFVTKIWNSYKFCKQNGFIYDADFDANNVSLEINQWILFKLEELQNAVEGCFSSHRFNEIANAIYQFVWGNYCDLYVEFTKSILYNESDFDESKLEVKKTMGFVFDGLLKIMHPLMPFISEYLYEDIHGKDSKRLALRSYPMFSFDFNKEAINNVNKIVEFIYKVRRIRVDLNISPAVLLEVAYQGEDYPSFIKNNLETVKRIARLGAIKNVEVLGKEFIQDIVGSAVFGISLEGVLDIDKEKLRLERSKIKLEEDMSKVLEKLNNKAFLERAQKEVIDTFKEQKDVLDIKIAKVKEMLNKIS